MSGIRIGKFQLLPGAYICLGIAAVVAVFSVVVYQNAQQSRMHEELKESAHKIMFAVEQFAGNGVREYPENFEQVVNDGIIYIDYGELIELPDNPFGPGKMKLLKPGDPAEPGGFVYFPNEPLIILKFGYKEIHYETYHLYFYSPHGRRDKWYTQVPFGVDLEFVLYRLGGGIG